MWVVAKKIALLSQSLHQTPHYISNITSLTEKGVFLHVYTCKMQYKSFLEMYINHKGFLVYQSLCQTSGYTSDHTPFSERGGVFYLSTDAKCNPRTFFHVGNYQKLCESIYLRHQDMLLPYPSLYSERGYFYIATYAQSFLCK